MATAPKPEPFSRGEKAYDTLFAAIQDGTLQPGARLREVELADWIGISRTPVREALGRLEGEGLVARDPHRGMIVARLDPDMVTELYYMREVLEGSAAGLAARHATDAEISTLRAIADRDRNTRDTARLAEINRVFHDALYRAAHNRYLVKTLNTLRQSMALLGQTTLAMPGRSATALEEHRRLIRALEKRDVEGATKAAREHIRAAYSARMKQLI